jgi:hypothetical protein
MEMLNNIDISDAVLIPASIFAVICYIKSKKINKGTEDKTEA